MTYKLNHIPFNTNTPHKHLDGVYKNMKDGDIAIFKNCRRKGFVCDIEGPYDAIVVNFNSVKHGKIRSCIVNLNEWMKILYL